MKTRLWRAQVRVALLFIGIFLGSTACVDFKPAPSTSAEFYGRVQTQTQGGLMVSTAVLGKKESKEYFGLDLEKKHVQALYLKVTNRDPKSYWLMPISIDPHYYSSNEVAYRHRTGHSGEVQVKMNEFFEAHQISTNIGPGETQEGFVYTNADFGSKEFGVDFLSRGELKRFNFVVPVPDSPADYKSVDFDALYPPHEIREVSLSELRSALENYPCCTSKKGSDVSDGDGVSLIIVG